MSSLTYKAQSQACFYRTCSKKNVILLARLFLFAICYDCMIGKWVYQAQGPTHRWLINCGVVYMYIHCRGSWYKVFHNFIFTHYIAVVHFLWFIFPHFLRNQIICKDRRQFIGSVSPHHACRFWSEHSIVIAENVSLFSSVESALAEQHVGNTPPY